MAAFGELSSVTIMRCLGIAVNALCAGGLFIFPLLSPALVRHHHFTQPQLTTIVLAGMVGQYPFAALVGKVLDARGARTCSLIAGFMFSLGFGLFAYEIADAPETPNEGETVNVFRRMVVYFGMIGLGTVFSYFSIVFSATQTFPRYIGVASGTSMALFGCSPLLLTFIADKFFTAINAVEEPVLNVTRFLMCLSITTGLSHLLGAMTLPGLSSENTHASSSEDIEYAVESLAHEETTQEGGSTPSDTSPLLGRRSPSFSSASTSSKYIPSTHVAVIEVLEVSPPQHGSTLDLICDLWFWSLLAVVAIVVGCCEMVIANLSPIFLSVRAMGTLSPILAQGARALTTGTSISRQVQLLSLTNTFSRLIIGPLADFMAPVPIPFSCATSTHTTLTDESPSGSEEEALPGHARPKASVHYAFPRTQYISRIAFLLGASLLCLSTFTLFLAINLNATCEESMSLLSIGVGFSYGTTFTILPGILTAIYGSANLGRNFGILSYAPFVGTSVFSYIYAFLVDRHSSTSADPGPQLGAEGPLTTCTGSQCWRTTFTICIGALAIACCFSGVLWKRWQGRV